MPEEVSAEPSKELSVSDPSPNGHIEVPDARRSSEQRRLERMPDELKREIGMHYEDRRIPSYKIAQAYGLSNNLLLMVVDSLGATRRGAGNNGAVEAGHFETGTNSGRLTWVSDVPEIAETVPEDVHKALERLITLPPRPEAPVEYRLVARPEPVAQPPARQESLIEWRATVRGELKVYGASIEDAISYLRERYPQVNVVAMRQVNPD